MRDIKSSQDVQPSLHPAARTNGTATGSTVDLQGFNGAMLVFSAGAWTDGSHTPALHESDDGTTFIAVGTADLLGTLTAVSGTAQQNAVQRQGYIGNKRYLRAMQVTATATTGALTSAAIVRGRPNVAPVA
ncbi:hypothetical protein [Azorhizobium doebereinerae]|uniref:hypothetical protein n=1 Tax=Azorhizobium doebereinerae TaxID=281091 RepID=UPI0003F8153B|nr:hypothetical protein [Azorhizobium doebereinerae]